MVLIDGIKYSCQTCITGHRTTKCTHTDRPLVEIKKKGRPISQCSECREIRKTKSIHGRCDCAARRNQVKAPARVLQNGIVDLVKARSPSPEPQEGAAQKGLRVSQLLNPCNCLNGGQCRCSGSSSSASSSPSPSLSDQAAQPVKSCCSTKKASTVLPTSAVAPSVPITAYHSAAEPAPSAVAPKPSSCRSGKTKAPSAPTPTITISPPSASGCCSSKSTPSPSLKPSPSAAISTLFLPQTHGTASCFCGDTCACVGCPTHDPAGTKRASLSTASAAVSCGCGSGGDESMDGKGGMAAKPCCGGAVGQLGLAQMAGLEELGRIREGAGRVRLPPLLWGGPGGGRDGAEGGKKGAEKEDGVKRGRLPSIAWDEGWGVSTEQEIEKDREKDGEVADKQTITDTRSFTTNPIGSLSPPPSNPSPKRGKNKRRHPPSPPPPPLRNTRSRTAAPPIVTTEDTPIFTSPAPSSASFVDELVSPSLARTSEPTEKERTAIQLDAEEEMFEDVDVASAEEGVEQGEGCGAACKCTEQVGIAGQGGIEQGEVGVGIDQAGGLGAFVPLSDNFLSLQQQLQAPSMVHQPFALDFGQLDPLAGLPPLPDLSNLGFDFGFLRQPLQHFSPPSIASRAPLPPPPPALPPSTNSGCCSSRSSRPTPTPITRDESLDSDLDLLRAEDIESYDFGGGGGATWPSSLSLSAKAFGAEQGEGSGQAGEMEEWEEDARVRAELMAAGFC